LDALVWRAQPDYLAQLGYPATELASLNRRAVERTRLSVERWRDRSSKSAGTPVLVSADLGPRGDGYQVADSEVTPERAHDYHAGHVAALAEAGVDLACALTMTSVNESIGLARAVAQHDLPLVVSPTVETDGRLPDRTSIGEFIERVDDATSGSPLFYMVNCAHPTHLEETLERAAEAGEAWLDRFRGLRANASTRSHAELDEATELDRGDPADLGRRVARLRDRFGLTLLGGCCGTDPEHIEKIAEATTRP
jgi:S-methylmethionine-dependent homocysteine/selenocysteine methylase